MADASVFILENVDFADIKGSNSEVRNCHINIGTGIEHSISDVANIIKNVVQYEGDIKWNPTKPNGTMRKLCDVSKLHSLGWHHRIELTDGIRMIYDWYLNE